MHHAAAAIAVVLLAAQLPGTVHAASRASPASEPSGTPEPAVWVSHEVIIDLHDLPRRYSCDELWYKFRTVLFAVGARPTQVLPYRCAGTAGQQGFSPSVQLTFYTPQLAQGAQASSPDLEATPRQVRIAPGAQAHLDSGDCELLRQLKDTLFRYLGDAVPEFSLACGAPRTTTPPFSMTVDALLPATTAAATPHASSPSSTARGT